MEFNETVIYLKKYLLDEMPEYKNYSLKFNNTLDGQVSLIRSLMNLRKPKPVTEEFKKVEKIYLQTLLKNMGLVDCFSLSLTDYEKIALWRGNIVRLKADAIVNAGNTDMLGCFVPHHNCLGPSTRGRVTFSDQNVLKTCYLHCLELARKLHLRTLVFPCISTGEQGFPKNVAAKIATETVKEYLLVHSDAPAVVFDVFTDIDERLYSELLYE